MIDESKLEYLCPLCVSWQPKKTFFDHMSGQHRHHTETTYPETLQELYDRFYYLGMWDER